ncbi:MAG: hypothetical protein KBA61_05635, partial [Spirochaetes bacterium]|nr:hypothetical protein [Spirochaetota bacterium]
HVGNTVYRVRGDTGSIISDSINSIFHLGQKYAPDSSYSRRTWSRSSPPACGTSSRERAFSRGG